jgi:hypothetical protein
MGFSQASPKIEKAGGDVNSNLEAIDKILRTAGITFIIAQPQAWKGRHQRLNKENRKGATILRVNWKGREP